MLPASFNPKNSSYRCNKVSCFPEQAKIIRNLLRTLAVELWYRFSLALSSVQAAAAPRTSWWSVADWTMAVNCSLCNCNNSRKCYLNHEKAAFSIKHRATIYSWTRISIISCPRNNRPKKDKVTISASTRLHRRTKRNQARRLSEYQVKTKAFSKTIASFLPLALLWDSTTNKVMQSKFTFHSFKLRSSITRASSKTKAKFTKPSMESSSRVKSRAISAFSKISRVRRCRLCIMDSTWDRQEELVARDSNLIRQIRLCKPLRSFHQVKNMIGSNNLTRLCHTVSRPKPRKRAKTQWRQLWQVQIRARATERMQVVRDAARAPITTWTISNISLIWYISVLILNRMLAAPWATWTKLQARPSMTCLAIFWAPENRPS